MRNLFLFSLFILFYSIMAMASNAEINFSISLHYINNFNKFMSKFEDKYLWEYNYTGSYYLPIGFTFSFNMLSEKGFGLDINFGPATYSYFKVAYFVGEDTKGISCYDFPISINLKYIISPKSEISPYLFIGRVKHFVRAGGNDLWDKEGFFTGIGLRFLKRDMKSIGLEISYDNSEVHLGYGYIKPYGLMLGLILTI